MSGRRRAATFALAVAVLLLRGAGGPAWSEPAAAPAAKAQQPTCDRAAFRLVVDVGHTVQVPGAFSARGVPEYEFYLRLAKLIVQQLIDAGFTKTILLITEGPAMRSLAVRVARANASGADLFLSIHHDSVPDQLLEKWQYEGAEHGFSDRFKGHSIYVSYDNPDLKGSLLFGHLLGKELKARGLHYTPHYTLPLMGHRQRQLVDAEAGVYRFDLLIVLRETRMPAVLLEAGMIINRGEELVMAARERHSLISAAALAAVESFCAERRPRRPDQVVHRPGAAAAAKQTRPAANAPATAPRP
jgi:N-acetylmuramoyl-L-alanine amidase